MLALSVFLLQLLLWSPGNQPPPYSEMDLYEDTRIQTSPPALHPCPCLEACGLEICEWGM